MASLHVVGYAQTPAPERMPGLASDLHAVLPDGERSRCGQLIASRDLSKPFAQESFGRCRVCVGGLMNDARAAGI